MIDTQKTLSAASCGAAIVTAPGGDPSAAVALAALVRPDMLVLAVAERLGSAAGTALCRRPPRPTRTQGWASTCPASGQTKPVQVATPKTSTPKTSTSTPAKKTTSSSGSSKSEGTSSSSSSSTKTSGALGFLNDPKLSVEDKLFMFMCYMADKYEKDLDKKLKEISGKAGGSSSTSSSGSKKKSGGGGLLGKVLGGGGGGGGIVGGLLGGGGGGALGGFLSMTGMGALAGSSGIQELITQASGPLLAAGACACGFPELAPVMLKVGPELTQGVLGALNGGGANGTSGSSGSGSTSGSSSGSSSSSSSGSGGDPEVSQKDMLELQRIQEKQKEMFNMVSNMLRTMHETKMGVINNLRA